MSFWENKILPQRFDEFKNVPAGQTHADIFHTFECWHVQLPVHVNSADELHWVDPTRHLLP